ncbi:unnamed protein product, partial [Polarella glacialis]
DVTNEESIVPTCDDKIVAKVLRVNWGSSGKSQQPSAGSNAASAAPASQAPPKPQPPASVDMLLGFDEGPARPAGGTQFSAASASPSSSPTRKDDFDMLFS